MGREEELVVMASEAKKLQVAAQVVLESLNAKSAAMDRQIAAMQAAIPALRTTTEDGIKNAMSEASAVAAKAVAAASAPVVAKLEGMLTAAGEVENRLRRVVAWASWRLAARAAAVVFVLWLFGEAVLWRYREDRQEAIAELEQLRAQAARLKVVDCELHGGPKGRKCLPITDKVYGEENSKTVYYPVW